MPGYNYKAMTRDGRRIEGSLEAADKRAAMAAVERLGHVPLSVSEAVGKAPVLKASKWKLDAAKDMKPGEVLLFTSELADLIEAGMTLGNALNCLANQGGGQDAPGKIAGDLRDRIMRGEPLSDAMKAHPKSFPPIYSNMIRAGEASGAMTEVLHRLGEHYERQLSMRGKIITALTYPAIVLFFGVIVVIVAMVKIVPKFAKIFDSMGAGLPLPTKILVEGSNFVIHYGWLVLIIGFMFFVWFGRYIRTEKGTYWWDGLKLKVPLIKGIIACGTYSSTAYTLRTLMSNGVHVLQALRIASETCGNAVIARALNNARERVTDGATISGPLAASGVFPQMMTDMLSIGEQTGDMPTSLNHIGKRYEGEMDRNIKIFTAALEPLLIVMVAVLVGFVAVSILMAVFKATSAMGASG